MGSDEVLLMTATVDVKRKNFHALGDARERLRQYIAAFILWMRCGVFERIVFLENSQSSFRLESLLDIAGDEHVGVEVLLIGGNEGSWLHGPSWGEARILEAAFSKSQFINEAKTFWKTTGRLFVGNISDLHRQHANDKNVFYGADSRFWKSDVDWYRRCVIPCFSNVSDPAKNGFEICQYRAVKPALEKGDAVWFSKNPDILGQSGQTLQIYGEIPSWAISEAESWMSKF